jgi:hypothetical protein
VGCAEQLVAINVGTDRSEYAYDGQKRRVRIIEKETSVVQSDTKVIWCQTAICEERAADGVTVTLRSEFTYDGLQRRVRLAAGVCCTGTCGGTWGTCFGNWRSRRRAESRRGICCRTVGRDERVIREYIRKQEQEDARPDQLGLWR